MDPSWTKPTNGGRRMSKRTAMPILARRRSNRTWALSSYVTGLNEVVIW